MSNEKFYTSSFEEINIQLKKLIEGLGQNKFIGSVYWLVIILLIAESLFPSSANSILVTLLNYLGAVSTNIGDKIISLRTETNNIVRKIRNYISIDRPSAIVYAFTYFAIMCLMIIAGFKFNSSWYMGIGVFLLVFPIALIGKIQKTIGNFLTRKEKQHPWIKKGQNKITISLLLVLFAIEFMIMHTNLFLIFTAIFMAFAFTRAGFSSNYKDPYESLKKMTYSFVGISFLFVSFYLLSMYSNSVKVTFDSMINQLNTVNLLAVVERNDQTEITQDIISESERTVWRLTLTQCDLYFSAIDGVDIENDCQYGKTLPARTKVRIIKDRKVQDKYGVIWVHVRYDNFSGYLPNRYLRTLTSDELTRFN